MKVPPTLTHKLIFDEVIRRGWTIADVSKNSYSVINADGKRVHFNLSSPEYNSREGVRVSADKILTLRSVEALGYQVAPYGEHTDEAADAAFLKQHAPIVVKPCDGQKSQGITVGVRTAAEMQAALQKALAHSKQGRAMLQKQLQGQEYRLLVIGDKLFAAAGRRPAQVVGDGMHTVAELVEVLNQTRVSGALEPIDASEVRKYLGDEQFNHVSSKDETVRLSDLGGMSAGGESVDVTDQVHPDYVTALVAIAQANGLVVCGFDILTTDIAAPMPSFLPLLEMNVAPGFKPHAFVSEGIARDPAPAMLDYVFGLEREAE